MSKNRNEPKFWKSVDETQYNGNTESRRSSIEDKLFVSLNFFKNVFP